jgi:hypothetical protein
LRRPFGSFHVVAKTGKTSWETSLFADQKRGAFLLPVKAEVRRKEKIAPGDTIEVSVSFGLVLMTSRGGSQYNGARSGVAHVRTRTSEGCRRNLPEPRPPVANYVPFVITGNVLFISGQVSAGRTALSSDAWAKT